MRLRPSEQESLTILRTAYHTCAHGIDVRPPVHLALRHFRRKAHSREFFEALRCYRGILAQSPPIRAQELKGQIDLILWQDLAAPWKSCWTRRIRAGVLEMPAEWIGQPASQVLTGARWHVVKNLICGIAADEPELDIALTTLLEVPWKTRYVATNLARSLLSLWEQRDEKRAHPQIARISRAFPEAMEHQV